MRVGFSVLLFLAAITSAVGQPMPTTVPPTPAPQVISVPFTPAEIEANLNLLNDAVKSIGLAQPQRLQDALVLLIKFQTALKVDAEMRAKAAAAAPESAPAITGPYRGPFPKLADPPPALPQ